MLWMIGTESETNSNNRNAVNVRKGATTQNMVCESGDRVYTEN